MDAREIAFFVLEQLPDVQKLDPDTFKVIIFHVFSFPKCIQVYMYHFEKNGRDLKLSAA